MASPLTAPTDYAGAVGGGKVAAAEPTFLGQLELVLKGGRVWRYHTKHLTRPESVAEHHHMVAWLAWIYTEGAASARLLMACLSHDLPEHVTGDLPSPTKRLMPGLKDALAMAEDNVFKAAGVPNFEHDLTPEDAEVLKFCDNFAGWLKCKWEAKLGNTTLANTESRYRAYLELLVADATTLSRERCYDMMDAIQRKGIPL